MTDLALYLFAKAPAIDAIVYKAITAPITKITLATLFCIPLKSKVFSLSITTIRRYIAPITPATPSMPEKLAEREISASANMDMRTSCSVSNSSVFASSLSAVNFSSAFTSNKIDNAMAITETLLSGMDFPNLLIAITAIINTAITPASMANVVPTCFQLVILIWPITSSDILKIPIAPEIASMPLARLPIFAAVCNLILLASKVRPAESAPKITAKAKIAPTAFQRSPLSSIVDNKYTAPTNAISAPVTRVTFLEKVFAAAGFI